MMSTSPEYPDSYSLFDQLAPAPRSAPPKQPSIQYPTSYSLFDKLAQPVDTITESSQLFDDRIDEGFQQPVSKTRLKSDLKQSKQSPQERRQLDLISAFDKGLKRSVSGELGQRVFGNAKQLEKRAETDPSFWEELVQEAGTITGDLPYLAAGATLGAAAGGALGSVVPGAGTAIGATVGGAFGATALPAFLKEALAQYRDFQEKGGDLTFGEFLQRADEVANKTLTEGLFGTILGAVSKAAPLLEKTPGIGKLFTSKFAKTAGTVAAEAATATAVPALSEGRLPQSRDFARALALFGGLKLAQLPSSVREKIQKQGQASGKTPEEFARSYPEEKLEALKTEVIEEAKPFEEIETPSEGKTLDEAISFEPVTEIKKEPKGASFRTAVVDELYPLQRYVEGTGVANLPITEDPYKMARLFKGWSGKAETFLEYKPFDPDTLDFKYKGFREIIRPYKEDLPNLSKYLVAKRAIELRKQGKETGLDISDAHRFIKENPQYDRPAKEIKVYQRSLLDYARKSGLITPETQKLWEELNENYVPFQRVIDEGPSEYFGKSMQPKQPFHELKGSKKPIIDPLESIVGNTYVIVRAAEQNRVLKSLVEFDRKHRGANEFIDLSSGTTEEPNLKSFFDYLKGEDTIRDDSFRYLDNGKFRTYKVPKEIAETLKGLKPEQIPFWGKMFAYPTRAVRTGAITLSPGTLLKLASVDQLEAFLYTDVGYVPYVDLAKGFFNAIKKGDLYYKWKAAGGDQSLAREMSRNFKRRKLASVAKKADFSEFKSMDGALRAFEAVSKPLEEATRLSVFEKTMKRKGMSPDALREAALSARESTLDFAKKGAKTKFLTQSIPFFNSAIQGADKFFQEVKRNPKVIPKAIASVTIPTLMLYWANKDRKEYQELPEWEKDKYWHFYVPFGDETLHMKMAKPYELGTVFGTTPERLAAWAYSQDKDNLKEIPKALWETFTPGFIPAALQPLIETYANKKIFTGAPLIPERLQKLPHEEQFTPYTTETAKIMGRLLSHIPYVGDTKAASPIVIDEWVNSYTAGVGNRLALTVENVLRKTGTIPEKVDPEKELSDYPVLKEFFGKKGYSTQAASIRKFYDESNKLSKIDASIRLARKEGRLKDVERLSKDFHPVRLKQAQRIRKAFGKNFQTIRNILVDAEHYTPAEKKILIDQLTNDMVGVSRSFLGKEKE